MKRAKVEKEREERRKVEMQRRAQAASHQDATERYVKQLQEERRVQEQKEFIARQEAHRKKMEELRREEEGKAA